MTTTATTQLPTKVNKLSNAPTMRPTDAPTPTPTVTPTESPTVPPTDAPTENPTEMPTENPTEMPTLNPTEAPTVNPTDAPTETPTQNPIEWELATELEPTVADEPDATEANFFPIPVPMTTTVPIATASNCIELPYDQIVRTVPESKTTKSVASQCVQLPKELAKNIVSVTANFERIPTAPVQLLITSEPQFVDQRQPTKKCQEICAAVKLPQKCFCVEPQKISANSLLFASARMAEDFETRHFSILSADAVRNMEFSTFFDNVAPAKISFDVPPGASTDSFLNNIAFTGAKPLRTIKLSLPAKEEDARLKMTVTPLVFGDKTAQRIHSKFCLINDDVACHVSVDPKYNYNVEIENLGKMKNSVELFTLDGPHAFNEPLEQSLIGKELSHSHELPLRNVVAAVAIAFIWFIGVFLLLKSLTGGRRSAKGFGNKMRQLFASSRCEEFETSDRGLHYGRLSPSRGQIRDFVV